MERSLKYLIFVKGMRRVSNRSKLPVVCATFFQRIFGEKGKAQDTGGLSKDQVLTSYKKNPSATLTALRTAIEMQKKFTKLPGVGFLAEKQIAMAESILKEIERSHDTTTIGSQPSVVSQPAAVVKGQQHVHLGSEIEGLFSELRATRAKKNEFRDLLEAKEKETSQLVREKKLLEQRDVDLRERLANAEQNVMLLNSESLQLKQDLKDAKFLQKVNEIECIAVPSNDSQLLKRANELTVLLKSSEDSQHSMQRKLDRLRRRDPLQQFSIFLNELTSNGNTKDTSQAHTVLRDAFQKGVHQAWDKCSTEVAECVVHACRQQVLFNCPHSNLDCIVRMNAPNDSAVFHELSQLCSPFGFVVKWRDDAEMEMIVEANSSVSTLGPFGYLFCWHFLISDVPSINRSSPSVSNVARVKPWISHSLATNEQRSRIDITATKSSAPGGQAANVSETHICASLCIDGKVIVTAECQETRSALHNRKLAVESLLSDKLDLFNKRLSSVSHVAVRVQQCTDDRWKMFASSKLTEFMQFPLDVAVVDTVRKLSCRS